MGQDTQVPVAFLSGEADYITSPAFVQSYYAQISAPEKQFVTISGCGYSPQYDSPEEFCQALKTILTPIADKR